MLVEAVPSPCVNVCRMHEGTGWCEGCKRTLDEIGAWGTLDDAGKRAVWQRIRVRRVEWRRLQGLAHEAGAEPT